jgi:dihydropyrimidine dehydrogenase (NAD+) subunit PreA
MSDPEAALPLSGIGGIGDWRDAAEFILLGCGTVQVCTAAMHYGYRIVEDMAEGLDNWMRSKGFNTIEDFRGLSLPKVTEWKHLNLNYKIVAHINEQKCIGCDLCHIACWDGAHQCIHLDRVSGPVDGHVELHPIPAEQEARSRAAITEHAGYAQGAGSCCETGMVRIRRHWRAFRAWMKPSVLAAIFARWFARWTSASRWCVWIMD